jgi:hypothetical protein
MNIPKNIMALLEDRGTSISNGEYASFVCEVEEQLEQLEAEERPMISPVEQMFFIEWKFSQWNHSIVCPEDRLELRPQHKGYKTGKFRLDFKVGFFTGVIDAPNDSVYSGHEEEIQDAVQEPMLGIEIDGHEWHEKTKEQARRDKERERFLVAQGWKILRFTGSEVFNHANKCVEEVADCARPLAKAYHKQISEFLSSLSVER